MTGPLSVPEMLAAFDAHPREQTRERQNPGRQAGPADRPRRPRSVPRRKIDRLGRRRVAGRAPARPACAGCAMSRASANSALVDRRLKGVLERDHQLHAIERAQAQLLDRRVRRQIRRGPRTSRSARPGDRCLPRRGAAWPPATTQSRTTARFSFRVPSVRGSSRSGQTSARRIF